jgi:Asp/Glu/hydantoin racemase
MERFLTLGRYAASTGADAILFTCSAFGPAIAAVKAELAIPVLTPNEAAFEAAVTHGRRIGLLVTFQPSLAALRSELDAIAPGLNIAAGLVDGALPALQTGDPDTHDRLILEAVAKMADCDAVVLGQFSMARAARRYSGAKPLLTTPASAVKKLRQAF